MKAKTLQINWHDKMPIFSVAFDSQPHQSVTSVGDTETKYRLATAGGDHNIRIWNATLDETTNTSKLEFIATLNRHSSVVNCIRWSPKDGILASGGDDGTLILWQQCEKKPVEVGSLEAVDDSDNIEHWRILQILRGCSSDIYDIVWSPQGTHIMAGCVDNSSRIWDIKENKCILTLTEHTNFVQGVSWDPMNQFVASQSSDRSMNVYKLHKTGTQITGLTCCARQSKITTVKETKESETKNEVQEDFMEVDRKVEVQVLNKEKDPCWNPSDDVLEAPLSNAKKAKLESSTTSMKLFHDDTLSSFFRRLSFSPDGSLLIAPAGIHRASPKENTKHVVYVFTRENLRGEPIARLGGFKKAPIAIKFSPVLYKHRRTNSNIEGRLLLPYRMIFAVACQDAVVVYDTSCLERPLAVVANLHFGTLTDLAWAPNGKILMMSSTDGYCSMVTFSENELGVSIEGSVVAQEEVVAMNYSDSAANPGEKKLEPLASTAVVNILHAGLIKKKKPTVPSMCPPVTMIQVEQSTGMEECNENVMV